MYTKHKLPAFYSLFQVTSGQMMPLRVTSNHVRSRDVISSHMSSISCKLQPCRNSSVHKTRVFGLLQPLSGDFR